MPLLYDQFGKEMKVTKRPETREVAVAAVRDRWSSYPSGGLTPVKLASIFKEADSGDIYRQAELFEEMEEKDTHLFSQLQTRKNAVMGLDYEILPFSDSAQDKKVRDFTADVFSGLTDLDDTLLDMLDAVGKGYSLNEIMWVVDGRYAAIDRFQWIHAKKAVFYDYGKGGWDKSYEVPRIVTEQEPARGETMPPFKLVYHRYKARSGYDTRAGVLRVCAWMYLFKNYSIKDWVAFAEIFGMPLRIGKYDPGANDDDKNALLTAISSLGSDAAGIISKNTEIEFVETVKSSGKDNLFENLANFCNKEISKAILGQTLTTQEGKSGSYSLGKVHDLVRHDLIKADCEGLDKTLKFQVVRPLVGYNFGWDVPLPGVKFKYEAPEDLKMLSEVYKNLSGINYPLTMEHVSKRFKVPVPKKGETVLESSRSAPMTAKQSRIAAKNGSVAAPAARFSPQQERIEALIDKTLEKATGALIGLLEPVKQMVLKANSLEELRDGILDVYGDMDPADLEELVARAMFAAELYGRFTVVE